MKLELRIETAGDEQFLRRLFLSVRRGEFVPLGLGEAQLELLLGQQFAMRESYYRAAYPDAERFIVEHSGATIGRLCIERRPEAHQLIDIALLPECSGQGIGGQLLDRVLEDAAASGSAVTLHVRRDNRALRLYQRKGFAETGFDGADIAMMWQSPVK